MYIIDIKDDNFQIHHQFSLPSTCEYTIMNHPPEIRSYSDHLFRVLSEFGTIQSWKQLSETKSLWKFDDGEKIICDLIWLSPIDDPYDVRYRDDSDLQMVIR